MAPASATQNAPADVDAVTQVATDSGEGTRFAPRQDVTVLDVFGDTASVKVESEPFVEYLHLARFGDRWLIVNALYATLVGA